ncbi:hypothetical protein PR002_g2916 [Phytophthora rubi]|uniref:Uncharacterized protein n=1 Tax=Phytophthora rubi TaxID=129364 RepID=A0A6A3NSP8_9STRA|nr:hypothetical protein PR002_g2916 [Phytophthora rubi]
MWTVGLRKGSMAASSTSIASSALVSSGLTMVGLSSSLTRFQYSGSTRVDTIST